MARRSSFNHCVKDLTLKCTPIHYTLIFWYMQKRDKIIHWISSDKRSVKALYELGQSPWSMALCLVWQSDRCLPT